MPPSSLSGVRDMARTLYLPDGSAPVLFSLEDFYLLVDERMGRKTEQIIRALAGYAGREHAVETILEKEIN